MARPFSLTTRSMEKDHPKPIIIILLIAIIILGAWNLWFFYAKISVYEVSINAHVTDAPEKIIPSFSGPGRVIEQRQNNIIATFPVHLKNSIYLGQKAIFYPALKHGEISMSINAFVSEIIPKQNNDCIKAELKTLHSFDYPIQLNTGTTGIIKLELEKITPFKLLLNKIKSSNVYK